MLRRHLVSVRRGSAEQSRRPAGLAPPGSAPIILGVAATVFSLLQYFVRRIRERGAGQKSERLLLNVLPAPVATRLKQREGIIADDYPAMTVLFADIGGFTPLSERISASELVSLLDGVFARMDALVAEHGVEKIKTIGDAYMVAAGIPLPQAEHAAPRSTAGGRGRPRVVICGSRNSFGTPGVPADDAPAPSSSSALGRGRAAPAQASMRAVSLTSSPSALTSERPAVVIWPT